MTEINKQVDGHAYFIRKPVNELEVLEQTLSIHHNFMDKPSPYRIAKTIELPAEEYKDFVENSLLQDHQFLKKHTLECYVNTEGIWQALKLINKDNPEETLLVQTEGAPYARYVAVEKYYPEELKQKINELAERIRPFHYQGNNWYIGTIDNYAVSAKVYSEPSQYGIDNGRISKLNIKDAEGYTIANYDRGWDVIPKEEYKDLYEKVIGSLERQTLEIKKERHRRNKEYDR